MFVTSLMTEHHNNNITKVGGRWLRYYTFSGTVNVRLSSRKYYININNDDNILIEFDRLLLLIKTPKTFYAVICKTLASTFRN